MCKGPDIVVTTLGSKLEVLAQTLAELDRDGIPNAAGSTHVDAGIAEPVHVDNSLRESANRIASSASTIVGFDDIGRSMESATVSSVNGEPLSPENRTRIGILA